jgi:type IV pilus assembly protein PilM
VFFSKVDNPIGLDISELSVKFVQFKKLGRHLDLAVFSDVPLPQGLMNHEIISSDRGVTDFLVDLFATKSYHSGRLKGRSVVASIPESKAFVRVINLPSLLPEELETAVPIEAEQYIPLPIDQMELDWQVIAPSQEPGAGSEGLKVLITATPKEYVANLVEVLNSAGLVVQAVEAESAAKDLRNQRLFWTWTRHAPALSCGLKIPCSSPQAYQWPAMR